jgi:hypothetical protein
MPMEFHIQHSAIKGTPVISLNTVTRVVHIRLLARQIHNARTFPTAAATLPACLRRSLPTAAQLFSNPVAPCVMKVMRTWLLACGWLPDQPNDGWSGSVVILDHNDEPATSGHVSTWIRRLRLSWEQLLHLRHMLVLFEPSTPSLSSATESAIYSCQCGFGRHALILHL